MNTHTNNTFFADTIDKWRHEMSSMTMIFGTLLGKNVNTFYEQLKKRRNYLLRSNVNSKSWHDFQLKTQSNE